MQIVPEGHWEGCERAFCDLLYMKRSASLFSWREIEIITNVVEIIAHWNMYVAHVVLISDAHSHRKLLN